MRSKWTSVLLLAAAATRPALARPVALPVVLSNQPVEAVELDLSPGMAFEVSDIGAGAVAARIPFLIAIRHSQLAPGKALRISVSLDAAVAPGTRLSFQPGASHGGTCRAGSLLPGIPVPVFESTDGAETGSCELRWTLDTLVHPRRAGSTLLTLHWKLESVIVSGAMARASRTSRSTAEGGTLSAGIHLPESPVAGAGRRGEIDRPERRRPPG